MPVGATAPNVVANPSFESGLTSWSIGPSDTENGNTGTCGYNGATAPGTETITGTSGFPATDGTQIALGSVQETAGARYACVLYQDVAIPAGATQATFSADIGVKYVNGMTFFNTGFEEGLFSTASIPNDINDPVDPSFPSVPGGSIVCGPECSGTTLVHEGLGPLNVTSVAGTSVRLAFIVFVNGTTGAAVLGIDNVSLSVNSTTSTPTVTSTATPTTAAVPRAYVPLVINNGPSSGY
jgi:hypothetical protein